jgi:transposase
MLSEELFRKPYPSDVSEEEWAFVAPYLALVREDAPQREHELREVYNGLRYIVKCGCPWRYLPTNLPPWWVVYQQAQRWIKAGVFESMAHDLRLLLRLAQQRSHAEPTAAVLDSRTLQSTPESGARAGYDRYGPGDRFSSTSPGGHDGAKRRKGSKLHLAVDTLGHLLALHVTPADAGDREQVGHLCEQVQQATGNSLEVAFVDQGYTGASAAEAAQAQGMRLEVVKLPEAKRGFVLLPRRWVVERSFAWATRFRRLTRDYERLASTVAGLHLVAFAILFGQRAVTLLIPSP